LASEELVSACVDPLDTAQENLGRPALPIKRSEEAMKKAQRRQIAAFKEDLRRWKGVDEVMMTSFLGMLALDNALLGPNVDGRKNGSRLRRTDTPLIDLTDGC
jgi:hypothetical protein